MNLCQRSGKTSYPTERDAHKAIAALKGKRRHGYSGHMHTYRCSHCGCFHTTRRDAAELRRLVTEEPNR